jgi:uncharacterized protein YutE (UPF0331/DUF86 family)
MREMRTNHKNLIIIVEEGQAVPSDLAGIMIYRPTFPTIPDRNFLSSLEHHLSKISGGLEEKIFNEPLRLLHKREFRAAVIAAFVVLESELREAITITASKEKDARNVALGRMIETAISHELINIEENLKIKEWINTRNMLVHTNQEISASEAEKIVNDLLSITRRIRDRTSSR